MQQILSDMQFDLQRNAEALRQSDLQRKADNRAAEAALQTEVERNRREIERMEALIRAECAERQVRCVLDVWSILCLLESMVLHFLNASPHICHPFHVLSTCLDVHFFLLPLLSSRSFTRSHSHFFHSSHFF